MSGSRETYRAGLIAENIAALYLLFKGYKIIGQRCKTPVGEIDLVVQKGKTIAFVEVKLRRQGEAALGAVNARAQGRITRAAQYLLGARREWQGKSLRFDVIALSWPFFIRHIDNAWRPGA